MSKLINIYCDESCHLYRQKITEHDRFMVIGGIACQDKYKHEILNKIKNIKTENDLTSNSEMKWTKIDTAKLSAYKSLVNYFFDNPNLSFRAIVVDKFQLNHSNFQQTHDDFYYKTYWRMLSHIIDHENIYHIYLDLKDTKGTLKIQKLHEILCNSERDFDKNVIKRMQEIRSHEVGIMQIVDIIIGAVSYVNRYKNDGQSNAKMQIIELIKERSKLSLLKSTTYGAAKFNLFHWQGQ